mgnify:CR=1 FL=1
MNDNYTNVISRWETYKATRKRPAYIATLFKADKERPEGGSNATVDITYPVQASLISTQDDSQQRINTTHAYLSAFIKP